MEPALLKRFIFVLFITFFSTQLSAKNSRVYFNNDDTKTYVDPYRGIVKPGSDFELIIVNQIRKAKKSIYVAVQELNLTNLAKELVAAKKRGVDVRVLLEDTYNRSFARIPKKDLKNLDSHMRGKIFEQLKFLDNNPNAKSPDEIKISNAEILDRDAIPILRKGGVPIQDDSNGKNKTGALMHHKFIILDNQITIVTSANLTRSGVHGDFDKAKSIGNANALLMLNSSSISDHFFTEFKILWSGVFKKKKPYRGFTAFKLDNSPVGIQFSPTDITKLGWDKSTNATIAKQIAKTKKEYVSSLFNFTSQEIVDALYEAKLENPKMHIEQLVEPTFATRFYSSLVDMWGLEIRNPSNCKLQEGNRPWKQGEKFSGKPILRHGDKLHHKFAVLDRETVIFGSHNWSESGNATNDETLMMIKDSEIAREFAREHNRLFRNANLGPKADFIQKIKDIENKCKSSWKKTYKKNF